MVFDGRLNSCWWTLKIGIGLADAHTRNCARQCSKAGYGILASDGRFLRFDSAGNDAGPYGSEDFTDERSSARDRYGRSGGRDDPGEEADNAELRTSIK